MIAPHPPMRGKGEGIRLREEDEATAGSTCDNPTLDPRQLRYHECLSSLCGQTNTASIQIANNASP